MLIGAAAQRRPSRTTVPPIRTTAMANATFTMAQCYQRSRQPSVRGLTLPADPDRGYRLTRRSRRALPITETELKLIAAAAIMGLSKRPKAGYSSPAAIGTPTVL